MAGRQAGQTAASRPAYKAAHDELNSFIDVFRVEVGRAKHTSKEKRKQVVVALSTTQKATMTVSRRPKQR